MAIDEARLNEFMGKFVTDIGAVLHAATVVVGDRLGLYKAMAEAGPATVEQLAKRTETDPRYLREWLSAQAASGYVGYDPASQRFSLSEEQSLALAQEGSPAFIPGAFQIAVDQFKSVPKMESALRTGLGLGWHEHDASLFHGTERFFRPGYAANLVSAWLPALDGVEARLQAGGSVADVGCGHGTSTIIMAQAYPKARFTGFDYHAPSIEQARKAAKQAGVADRVNFEVASAKDFPGRAYDLVTFFDCLHDMGDPVGAAAHVSKALASNGTWMIVEPFANDRLEDNLNPVGRVYYSASSFICTPASRSQEVGLCLGAQAGEARLREVVTQGGFKRFRRAAETPFNIVLEARL
ncbi:class I SAM-dependent methyltransferase [Rivibacter subsaxonicus]|uniref:Methyltransferase family protein n=1 Tax=Rivibacter subsaxonicus TaxID=457575 RepID=A0A4Q7W003_9BURK|nr:class I SAM-dependent methyltransferase [Rivibacter subsaxonicus]RZU02115.1 methyltransferase family protein [Rivibacter subsaxonicus]